MISESDLKDINPKLAGGVPSTMHVQYGLPHPGFLVLDSPLIAYYKSAGKEDDALQLTDLKVKFFEYLVKHHSTHSQIIVIDNSHPPESVNEMIATTVFTNNPEMGRAGLL